MILADDVSTILGSAARLTVPLAFAGCGEYLAERAGTLNISIEAMLIGGACSASLTATATGSPVAGLLAGGVAGLAVALVHATLSHRLAANTFVVGLTLIILLTGLGAYLYRVRTLHSELIGPTPIPGLSRLPVVGDALFALPWPAYLLAAVVPVTWLLVERTRFGLEVRAAGEDPRSADLAGVDVNRRRRQALLVAGLLSGVGGAYLVVAEVGTFNPGMTGGRGFIVIAAVIFGGWTLRGTLFGCALFGAADALRLALPPIGYNLNPELLISAPYLLALAAMMVYARRNRRPAALAEPFDRSLA